MAVHDILHHGAQDVMQGLESLARWSAQPASTALCSHDCRITQKTRVPGLISITAFGLQSRQQQSPRAACSVLPAFLIEVI